MKGQQRRRLRGDARCSLLAELREVLVGGFEQKLFVIPETNDGGIRAARRHCEQSGNCPGIRPRPLTEPMRL
jgi:hypothetical protein